MIATPPGLQRPNGADDDALVPAHNACPMCGERHQDRLVWIDDERVRCLNCDAVYAPGGGSTNA